MAATSTPSQPPPSSSRGRKKKTKTHTHTSDAQMHTHKYPALQLRLATVFCIHATTHQISIKRVCSLAPFGAAPFRNHTREGSSKPSMNHCSVEDAVDVAVAKAAAVDAPKRQAVVAAAEAQNYCPAPATPFLSRDVFKPCVVPSRLLRRRRRRRRRCRCRCRRSRDLRL